MSPPATDPCAVKVGIIGGSGLEDPDILENVVDKTVTTPFGNPSDVLRFGTIHGVPCVLLSRHGRDHSVSPTNINYRANIWALKQAGCTHVLVTTACGSLKEEIKPGDVVFLDQFIDRTYNRTTSFYDSTPGGPKGVCHIPMCKPFCPRTRQILIDVAKRLGIRHHAKGTNVCIEGPRFSTLAESNLFRSWGGDTVGMTVVPECPLAKEVALCYASVALPTDYDCWREDEHEWVSVDLVMQTFRENAKKATDIIRHAVEEIAKQDWTEYIAEQEKLAKSSIML